MLTCLQVFRSSINIICLNNDYLAHNCADGALHNDHFLVILVGSVKQEVFAENSGVSYHIESGPFAFACYLFDNGLEGICSVLKGLGNGCFSVVVGVNAECAVIFCRLTVIGLYSFAFGERYIGVGLGNYP